MTSLASRKHVVSSKIRTGQCQTK